MGSRRWFATGPFSPPPPSLPTASPSSCTDLSGGQWMMAFSAGWLSGSYRLSIPLPPPIPLSHASRHSLSTHPAMPNHSLPLPSRHPAVGQGALYAGIMPLTPAVTPLLPLSRSAIHPAVSCLVIPLCHHPTRLHHCGQPAVGRGGVMSPRHRRRGRGVDASFSFPPLPLVAMDYSSHPILVPPLQLAGPLHPNRGSTSPPQ